MIRFCKAVDSHSSCSLCFEEKCGWRGRTLQQVREDLTVLPIQTLKFTHRIKVEDFATETEQPLLRSHLALAIFH